MLPSLSFPERHLVDLEINVINVRPFSIQCSVCLPALVFQVGVAQGTKPQFVRTWFVAQSSLPPAMIHARGSAPFGMVDRRLWSISRVSSTVASTRSATAFLVVLQECLYSRPLYLKPTVQ